MIKVGAKYKAPLHNADLDVLLVADAPQAAHVNYLTLLALGEVAEQQDGSRAAARVVTDGIAGRPLPALLEKLRLLSPEVRTKLTREAEHNLTEQTGQKVALDDTHPSAPLLIWSDRCMYAVTDDGYAIMGLRSNRTHSGIGRIVPPGIGWASVGPDGTAVSPQADARKEFKEEFGLQASAFENLGVDRTSNTVEGFTYDSADKTQTVVGVIPAFSYAACTRLDDKLAEVVDKARLNNENFGMLAFRIADLENVASGKPVVAKYFSSQARAACEVFAEANFFAQQRAVPIEEIRAVASEASAPRISAKDAQGQTAHYGLSPVARYVRIGQTEDFSVLTRDFLAETLLAAEVLGFPVSKAGQDYARGHANLEPVTHTSAPAINPRIQSSSPQAFQL